MTIDVLQKMLSFLKVSLSMVQKSRILSTELRRELIRPQIEVFELVEVVLLSFRPGPTFPYEQQEKRSGRYWVGSIGGSCSIVPIKGLMPNLK